MIFFTTKSYFKFTNKLFNFFLKSMGSSHSCFLYVQVLIQVLCQVIWSDGSGSMSDHWTVFNIRHSVVMKRQEDNLGAVMSCHKLLCRKPFLPVQYLKDRDDATYLFDSLEKFENSDRHGRCTVQDRQNIASLGQKNPQVLGYTSLCPWDCALMLLNRRLSAHREQGPASLSYDFLSRLKAATATIASKSQQPSG